jgi:hypothetical protein
LAPGEEGAVTLRLDTKGYDGPIRRKARIQSNDPQQPVQEIIISGRVKVPISLSKGHVIFKGKAGQSLEQSIDVTARLERPLSLEPVRFDLQGKLNVRIEEIEKEKMFRIHFSTTPELTGSFHGLLQLKTNYPEKPELFIRIRGRLNRSSSG